MWGGVLCSPPLCAERTDVVQALSSGLICLTRHKDFILKHKLYVSPSADDSPLPLCFQISLLLLAAAQPGHDGSV